jgi:hypothetical protein
VTNVSEAVAAPPAPEAPGHGGGMSLDRVWESLPILIPVLVSLISSMGAIDLAYQVRAGDLIISTHHIPSIDTFTFTVFGRPWVDQQWGAQVLLAAAHRLDGWATVSVLEAALIGLTFCFIYLACRARGARVRTASLLSIAAFVVADPTLAMRPQLFAVAIFSVALWALASRAEHPARVWLVPVLTVFWANIHGSFVLAPAMLGLSAIEEYLTGSREQARRLMLIGAVTLLATFANPFGPFVWRYA